MLQGLAELEQQGHDDPLLIKGLIDVFGSAMHLPRKPRGRSPLPFQFSLDEASQMEFFCGDNICHIVSN